VRVKVRVRDRDRTGARQSIRGEGRDPGLGYKDVGLGYRV
jgi:hypothetical protein